MSCLPGTSQSCMPAFRAARPTPRPTAQARGPLHRRTVATLAALAGAVVPALAAAPSYAAAETIRVTVGANPVVDATGARWAPDSGFTGGGTWTATPPGGDIKGTTDDALYLTERWGLSGWSRAVPNGTYEVTLKLREGWFDAPGQRVFDVSAEGTKVVANLDVYAVAGKNTAYDRTFPVTVRDGRLNLAFSATRDDPMVSAIQVRPACGAPTPTPTSTPTTAPTTAPTTVATTALSATAVAQTSTATLTWSAPATPVKGWTVGRDGVDDSGYGAWSTAVDGAARDLTFGDLVPGRTYTLHVVNRDTNERATASVTPGSSTAPPKTPTPTASSPAPAPTTSAPAPSTTSAPAPSTTSAPAWPLAVGPDQRHLVDTAGRPFFLVGDTAWSLIQGLPVSEAKTYIDARKAQGYNTILTNAIFRNRDMDTPRGLPFADGDLRHLNEAYWAGMDEIVRYARSRGVTLYVGMIWFADAGGWGDGTMPSDAEFRSYGTWLGNRYRDADNVIWFAGGDDSDAAWPPKADLLVGAFKSAHPRAVVSYHSQDTGPQMRSRAWHDFYSFQFNSNSEPYPYTIAREVLGFSPRRPVLDMEPAYDPSPCCSPDNPTTEPQENRRYGWWTTLSGALGVVYGGPEAAWHVGFASGWKTSYGAINRPAAVQTATIGKVLARYDWSSLVPDWDGTVLGDRGYGGAEFVAAARSGDGRLIMAYTPVARSVTVDLTRLSGPGTAIWIDPATGDQVGAAMAVDNRGQRSFASPLDEDALLVLTAR